MKNKIAKICFMLVLVLSAVNAHSEVITGISEPFQFGSPPPSVPLSFLAFAVAAGLIGLYSYFRHFRSRKEAV
jgi:hypothetical protein